MGKKFKGTYFISSISFTTMLSEFGLSSVFTLFMVYVLHFSTNMAPNIYSYYYGFAYLLPIVIGYITDKYMTRSNALSLGFVSMITALLFLSFSSSLYEPSAASYNTFVFNLQNLSFAAGLLFMAVGSGFANISIMSIINAINNEDNVTHAFSIYYPIINIGIMLGSVIMTLIIGADNYPMYKWSFLLFALIMVIGLLSFHMQKSKYLIDNDGNPMKDEQNINSIRQESNKLLQKISSKSILEIRNLNLKERFFLFNSSIKHHKEALFVFLIFLLINIFYRIAYSQTSISMVFFIDFNVIRDLDFYEIPVQMFCILNPLFIIFLSPLFIKLNNKIEEKNINFGFVKRIIVAMLFITLCYILMSILGYLLDVDALPLDKISIEWILLFELILAISELSFSVASYSAVSDLAPEKYYSLFFGLFTATRAISMYLSGQIAILFPEEEPNIFIHNIPINGLMTYFLIFVAITSFAVITLLVFRKRLERIIEEEDHTV